MATTNDWAHAWLRIREFARIWTRLRSMVSDSLAADEFWTYMETVVTGDGCVFDPDVDQGEQIGVLAQRALMAGVLSGGRSLLDPLMLQLSRAMGYPQSDPVAVFPILYRYMALNEGSFKSAPKVEKRTFTRGSWTAGGSNQGNGTVLRQTSDAYDLPLEADAPDVLKFNCTVDANSGANPGQEQFLVQGLPFRDVIARYAASTNSIGVGNQILTQNLVGRTADDTRSLLVNPSFADSSGTGATFALTGWTVASGAASTCSIDTSQYYRASNVESTPGSLKTTATVAFKQKIPASQLNASLCYMAQMACNFSAGGATGSVRMRLGTEAVYLVDVTVNSGVAGWNTVRPTIDKKLYYQNFAGTGDIYLRFDITVTSGTYILVDDVVLAPFQNIAGKLLWAIGGTTPWVVNDKGTITDSVSTTNNVPTVGDVQTMLSEVYGRSLPAFTPATKPGASTVGVTTGGTGASGTYGVCVTFYNGTTLLESAPSSQQNVILDGTNDRIDMSAIPTGPGGTTDRYIYITQKNDGNISGGFSSEASPRSAMYYVAALGDNVATTKTFDPTSIDLTKPLSVIMDI